MLAIFVYFILPLILLCLGFPIYLILLVSSLVAVLFVAAMPVYADGVTGQYIEARTCEVFTGPCFANADTSLTGKHAVLGWKVDKGSLDNVQLDGLGVVAVVAASDTLGLKQTAPAKAVLIVDAKATAAQREALIRLAKKQGGDLVKNVVAIKAALYSIGPLKQPVIGVRSQDDRCK